jgi:hypothetical protein
MVRCTGVEIEREPAGVVLDEPPHPAPSSGSDAQSTPMKMAAGPRAYAIVLLRMILVIDCNLLRRIGTATDSYSARPAAD